MSDSISEPTFSNYGVYVITENLELSLPNITLRIEKIGENVFSYTRKDSEDNIIEKVIPTKSHDLTIELTPIRPLNFPAKRTNYLYLDLETPVFLSKDATATVFIQCPIEIGVFLLHDGHKDSLDWVTCDPINSRFSLYGPPESGTLCKYAKCKVVESYEDSIPFVNAVLKVNLKNELDIGHSISSVIFPISGNSIYYKNSQAIIDSLNAVLKKKLTIEVLDVSSESIETDWAPAPTYERTEPLKRIDMGIE